MSYAEQTENISQRIISSEDRYKDFLTFASKGNIGLLPFHMQVNIYDQRKASTIVNTYKTWRMNGYQVKRGEHGIRVAKSDGGSLALFDVSQTVHFSGPEINEETIWDRELAKELGYSNVNFSTDYVSNYADYVAELGLSRLSGFSGEQKEKILSFARTSLVYMINERLDISNEHISFGTMPAPDEYEAIRDIISSAAKDAFHNLHVIIQNRSRYRQKDFVKLTIEWSEHPVFYEINDGKETERYTDISFELGNKVLEELDHRQHTERTVNENIGYYHKTSFVVEACIDGIEYGYSGRFDIGDGEGGLIGHIRSSLEWNISPENPYRHRNIREIESTRDYLDNFIPFLESHTALTEEDEKLYAEIMEIADKFYETKEIIKEEDSGTKGISRDRGNNTFIEPEETEILNYSDIPQDEELSDDEIEEILEKDRQIADERYEVLNGKRAHYERNMVAIKVMKEIEGLNREATAEEIRIMERYSGWGGLPEVFDGDNAAWNREYTELKNILTDEEYKEARSSVNSAFYTDSGVIAAIYEAVEKMGFDGGKVLEPAMGTGKFYLSMPDSLKKNCDLYGVEKDNITGRLARLINPDVNIQIKGFEETAFEKNSFDMVIGNIPFGNFSVYDPAYKTGNYKIHDYFIVKSLDLVREGGIVAVITSKGTMDKKDTRIRSVLARKAELAGAIRLPQGSFYDTAVTSDILFFVKKADDRELFRTPEWVDVIKDSAGVPYNVYFHLNRNNMIGTMQYSSMYGGESVTELVANDKTQILSRLHDIVSNMVPEAEYIPVQNGEILQSTEVSDINIIPADPDVKNFTYTVKDGTVYYRQNDVMEEKKGSERSTGILKGYCSIRNILKETIEAQKRNCSDEELRELQDRLNREYDLFVKRYGNLSSAAVHKVFGDDIECPLVESMEEQREQIINGEKTVIYEKAAIFSKRTIRPFEEIRSADNIADALSASMSVNGRPDIKYMAELMEKEENEIIEALLEEKLAFFSPEREGAAYPVNSCFVPREEYLSGNVREKLKNAEAYIKSHPESTYMRHNVEELNRVMPAWIAAEDIKISIGAGFIRTADYEKFLGELIGREGSINISKEETSSSYFIENKNAYQLFFRNVSRYGTKRMPALNIFEALLNKKGIEVRDAYEDADGKKRHVRNEPETIAANEKADEIKRRFAEWLFEDGERKEYYENRYNELFNSEVLMKYDGSYLNIPYMNTDIELREHQKNAVARILRGNTLLAHSVGGGKTYTMAAACMEMRRLKIANKPVIVVLNPLIRQFAADFMKLFPTANILVTTDRDFEKKKRQVFISKIATGDYDAVIMGHSQFEKIGLSPQRQEKQINEQIEHLENIIRKSDNRFTIKILERKKKQYQFRLEKLMNANEKDRNISFEDLGIDAILVDEAHEFKNLDVETKMSRVSGVQTASSQRAMDLYMKIKYIRELKGERNIVFATGTPLSNTICEMYNWQKYLAESDLRKKGINNFDDWVSMFGEIRTVWELAPEGNHYQSKEKIDKFRNIPELRKMFNKFSDVKQRNEIGLALPELKEGKYDVIKSEANTMQKKLMEDLVRRAEDIRNGNVRPEQDNMLALCNDARLLAADPRLLIGKQPGAERSKLDDCADNVYRIYRETESFKGTQIIFSDIGTPTSKKDFNVYSYIKEELIKRGVPDGEICFIHEAKNDRENEMLQEAVRQGSKRIIIGSTKKLGTGTNIQNRLVAEHDLDVPWRPMDVEQREGRIVCEGNLNKEVSVYRYITQGTFDAYNWNIIENKQYFISQILFSEEDGVREHEDIGADVLKYAEFKAVASGNPKIKEKLDTDAEIKRLEVLKRNYSRSLKELEHDITVTYPTKIRNLTDNIEAQKEDMERHRLSGREAFKIKIEGKYCDNRAEAGKKIMEILKQNAYMEREVVEYRGFRITGDHKYLSTGEESTTVFINGKSRYRIDVTEASEIGVITRIDNVFKKIPDFIRDYTDRLNMEKKNMELARAELEKPFAHQDRLNELYGKQRELEQELFKKPDGREENKKEARHK